LVNIHRSQTRNKADCLKKLKSFLDQALIEPKTREQWQEIGEKGKATRKKDKIHTKNKKSNRRGGDFY
jgi:protein subunit release factor A